MKEIRDKIREMIAYPRCVNFWEGNLPVPDTTGEGYTFKLRDENVTTEADRDPKTGKRIIRATISSYVGYCCEAEHYYCRIVSYINNVTERGTTIGGYLGGHTIPIEYTDIDFELGRKVTQEEIDKNPERWNAYHPGDMTNAFTSRKELLECLDFMKTIFPEDKWEWVIDE